MDETLLQMGEYGREAFRLKGVSQTKLVSMFYGKLDKIKGYRQLIEDYKWYMENSFERHIDIVRAEGEFIINWNGII